MPATVLIVEDEPTLADLIRINLDRAGFACQWAPDAATAVKLSAQADLVLLDVLLPDGNGFDLCRSLRAAGSVTPIVVVTALGDDDEKLRGFECGADDYVTKPFNPRELVARVEAVLRRTGRIAPHAELRLDPEARRAFVRGKEVPLSPKEFELLRYFMGHPGRLLSRDTLLDAVWGVDFLGDPKTVDVHVRRLREKVERIPEDPQLIQTVWGAGYRYAAG